MKPNFDSADNGQLAPAKDLGIHYQHIKAAESARQALLARRPFSLRIQLYLGFLLVFLFAVGTAALLLITIYQIEAKLRFLEIFSDYAIQIQQARRFEKNYFLYGTNLSDALETIYQAKGILEHNIAELGKIRGKDEQDIILPNIDRYEGLLSRLVELNRSKGNSPNLLQSKKKIELELRIHGQKLVSYANELINRENKAVADALQRSRQIHLYSLALLLIFIVINAYLLGSRILSNIARFAGYARRIAAGDPTPITPDRRFRNEFTDLALAVNEMILEREKREAVLIQSHKMRAVGTLTAGVAHELNNPLNNITLTVHMLLEEYDNLSDVERREMIEDVISETARSKKIISNLLDFARETGSQLEPLDLAQLLRDTIDLAANQVKLSGIKMQFQATDNLPRIHGDGEQLKQVFLNLILNAIDASPKGSKIQVLVLPGDEAKYLAVKVIDSGRGIPRHILNSIFDPFFTTKAKGRGSGLGLSVSQGIVGKHGGRILVNSTEGKGSTFTVVLPVTTFPAEAIADRNHSGES